MDEGNRPALSPAQSLLRALIVTVDNALESATYLFETRSLLRALRRQLEWYENALLQFHALGRRCGNYDEYDVLSRETLAALQNPRTGLVEDVKGLCEGTTEAIPYALATYINYEFQRLLGDNLSVPKGTRPADGAANGIPSGTPPEDDAPGVALCPFRQFNFFYQDVGRNLASVFEKLDSLYMAQTEALKAKDLLLQQRPAFPKTHAMIGFQYAMGDDVLYHSVLFHELGHHMFDAKDYRNAYETDVLKLLESGPTKDLVLKEAAPKDLPPEQHDAFVAAFRHKYLAPLVGQWVGELFADSFAVAMSGPQYCLAFDNLTGPSQQETTFSDSHPADLFRRHQQWETLSLAGWAAARANCESSPSPDTAEADTFCHFAQDIVARLRPADDLSTSQWKLQIPRLGVDAPGDPILEALVKVLRILTTRIAQDAINCVGDARKRADEFWKLGPHVKALFENAVVPSTVVLPQNLSDIPSRETGPFLGATSECPTWAYYPQPSTVMNVARLLYQSGCRDLLAKWPPKHDPGEEPEKDKLFRVHSRLSDWTQKAVADWLLLRDGGHRR